MSRAQALAAAPLALLAVGLWPQVAVACAVCGAADESSGAFLASTAFLSLLPLAMIFAGVGALHWASKHPDAFQDPPPSGK